MCERQDSIQNDNIFQNRLLDPPTHHWRGHSKRRSVLPPVSNHLVDALRTHLGAPLQPRERLGIAPDIAPHVAPLCACRLDVLRICGTLPGAPRAHDILVTVDGLWVPAGADLSDSKPSP